MAKSKEWNLIAKRSDFKAFLLELLTMIIELALRTHLLPEIQRGREPNTGNPGQTLELFILAS